MVFALLALGLADARAAEPEWTLTVDPLTLAIGFVHLQVERALGDRASIYVTPSLRLYDGVLADVNGPYRGLGAEVGGRVFLRGEAPEGLWLMARGTLARVHTTAPLEPLVAPGGYTSGLVGATWILGPGLTLSGGAGLSWFRYGVAGYGVHGLAPAAHTALGWAF